MRSMDVSVGFLTDDAVYSLPLPRGLEDDPDGYAVVSVLGTRHSVQYSPAGRVEFDSWYFTLEQESSINGRTVRVFQRSDDPPQTTVAWAVSRGWLWTQFDPTLEGTAVLPTMLGGIGVKEDRAGIPRIVLGSGVAGASKRDHVNRDFAMYVSRTTPLALTLVNSQGLPGLRGSDTSSGRRVKVPTQFGIDVHVSGPLERGKDLAETAREVAEALSRRS
jgi:hypothetical protein